MDFIAPDKSWETNIASILITHVIKCRKKPVITLLKNSAQLALLAISDLIVGIMQFQTDETMQRIKL